MNLFDDIPQELPEELFTPLLSKSGLRIERIVSAGHKSEPNFWYNQEENEWIYLVEGSAELTFEAGRKHRLKKGDTLLIPAHQKHQLTHTSTEPKCIWLAVFWSPDSND